MPYLHLTTHSKRQNVATFFILLLIAVSLVAPAYKASGDDFTPQTLLTIDLGTSNNFVNLEIFGAAADDHISGNGDPNTFTNFPRAHALATGDFNKDGFDDLVIGAPDVDFTPQGGSLKANAGAVYILLGRPNFTNPTIVDANTASAL